MIIDTSAEALQHYSVQAKLPDERLIQVRAIHATDKHALQLSVHQQSARSKYFRFFQSKNNLSEQELANLTKVDFINHIALVAHFEQDEIIAGVGRYILNDVNEAEITFAVHDSYHRLGIATLLLHHLTLIAQASNINYFRAMVMPENHKMLRVLSNSGLHQEKMTKDGAVDVRLTLVA